MKTKTVGYILASMLLFSGARLPASRRQAKAQGHPVSPSTAEPGNAATASGRKVFAAMLQKTLDVKKLKAVDTFTAYGGYRGAPTSYLLTFVGRVVEARQQGKGNKDSLLVIRFEKVRGILPGNQEVPVDLALQAIVAPLAVKWSPSPIIVDSYPCDSKTDPKCVEKENKEGGLSHLGDPTLSVCENRPTKANPKPTCSCDPLSEASGLYGFPDFSVLPLAANPDRDFAITSVRTNVHFEEGTYFVLSGPDPPAVLSPQP